MTETGSELQRARQRRELPAANRKKLLVACLGFLVLSLVMVEQHVRHEETSVEGALVSGAVHFVSAVVCVACMNVGYFFFAERRLAKWTLYTIGALAGCVMLAMWAWPIDVGKPYSSRSPDSLVDRIPLRAGLAIVWAWLASMVVTPVIAAVKRARVLRWLALGTFLPVLAPIALLLGADRWLSSHSRPATRR